MITQISIKDVKKAVKHMNGSVAVVRVSDNPTMFMHLGFGINDDGSVSWSGGYQVNNASTEFGDNVSVSYLVASFNEAMKNYDEQHNF